MVWVLQRSMPTWPFPFLHDKVVSLHDTVVSLCTRSCTLLWPSCLAQAIDEVNKQLAAGTFRRVIGNKVRYGVERGGRDDAQWLRLPRRVHLMQLCALLLCCAAAASRSRAVAEPSLPAPLGPLPANHAQ